jgi:hypothetical protein
MLNLPLKLTLIALLRVLSTTPHTVCSAPIGGRQVPADFVGDRVFVRWVAPGYQSLRVYTDTGGGLLSLFPKAVQRLSLPVDTLNWTEGADHGTQMTVRIPSALNDALVPPIPSALSVGFWPKPKDSTTVLLLVEYDGSSPEDEPGYEWDGRLGSSWFADRVWTIDYPNRRIYFDGTKSVAPTDPSCWVPLGFKTDSTGHRTNSFPRITARIDGEEIQFLMDTGAHTELTDSAWRKVGSNEPRHRATSFITTQRFEQWHKKHPEWLIVPNAEKQGGASMMRVPTIEVGGQQIGPVWFTERPDRNFKDFMSQYMDQPIEGALGGSAWRYVTLVLDYPGAKAALLTSP